MKKIVVICSLLIASLSTLLAAPGKGGLALASHDQSHTLIVKFAKSTKMRADVNGKLYSKNRAVMSSDLTSLTQKYDLSFESLLKIPEDKLEMIEQKIMTGATKRGANDLEHAAIGSLMTVNVKDFSNEKLLQLAHELEQLPEVQYCYLQGSKPIEPPSDIMPETNDMTTYQTYLETDPGMNVKYAWDMGLTGAGVRIADIEYDWNLTHEEWNDKKIHWAPGLTAVGNQFGYRHGTAVSGILFAGNNGYGVTGIAHGADEYLLFPETSAEGKGWNRAFSMGKALECLKAGDIFLLEMQYSDANTNWQFVPAEYQKPIWDITRALTDMGVVVVATGSNGASDMDGYTDYMSWGHSGAIMVGAGTTTPDHYRLNFSTYGSRFDIQAWGQGVMTTGSFANRPDLFYRFDNDPNQEYTSAFGGTSAAGPLAAGAIALVQEYAIKNLGRPMSAKEIRDLLVSTGYPQRYKYSGYESYGHVGPAINLKAALEKLMSDNPVAVCLNGISSDDNSSNTLESNENGNLDLKVINSSTSAKSNLNISVEAMGTNSSLVTFPTSSVTVSNLNANSSVNSSLKIKAAANIPANSEISLKFTVTGGANYSVIQKMTINPTAKLMVNDNKFIEAVANNGSVKNSIKMEIVNDEFISVSTLSRDLHYQVENLPSGLIPMVKVLSKNVVEISLNGSASSHNMANSVKNMRVSFLPAAMKSGKVSHIANNGTLNLELFFRDSYKIVYQKDNGQTKVVRGVTDWLYFRLNTHIPYSTVDYGLFFKSGSTILETYSKPAAASAVQYTVFISPYEYGDEINHQSLWARPADGGPLLTLHDSWKGRSGFVGLEFNMQGEAYFGWMQLKLSANSDTLSLVDYAYHSKPGTYINAGEISSSDIPEDRTNQKEFGLLTNYPNPFNPTTTISFNLPKEEVVELSVYNAKGEFVQNLLNKKVASGRHSVNFDGVGLNSGVYFYQLKSGNSVKSSKMLLIK